MTEISNLERGRLRIACLPAAASFLMPRVLAAFVRDRPDVTVSLMSRSSPVVADWIASQQYDVGLAETPAPRAAFILQTFELDCVCAMRRDDPLAEKPVITPLDLDDAPMAALYPDHATNRLTRSAFAGHGRAVPPALRAPDLPAGAGTGGAGPLPLHLRSASPPKAAALRDGGPGDLVVRPLSPRVPYPISILTPAHRPASLLARAFVEHLAEALRRFGHLDDREIP